MHMHMHLNEDLSYLSYFINKYKDHGIRMDRDYQKPKPAWTDEHKEQFIKDLTNGSYFLGQIILRPIDSVLGPDGEVIYDRPYDVIDGRERITALMDYVKILEDNNPNPSIDPVSKHIRTHRLMILVTDRMSDENINRIMEAKGLNPTGQVIPQYPHNINLPILRNKQ